MSCFVIRTQISDTRSHLTDFIYGTLFDKSLKITYTKFCKKLRTNFFNNLCLCFWRQTNSSKGKCDWQWRPLTQSGYSRGLNART